MRKTLILTMALASIHLSAETVAEITCKNLKSCAEWAAKQTNLTFELGKLEKRSLKVEKDLDLNEGSADVMFSFILSQSEMTRIKRENGNYEVISLRDLKDYTFPIVKAENVTPNFDIQATEFIFNNNKKLKNAMLMIKKMISKNGRVVEATEGNRLFVTDTGHQLVMFRSLVSDL